MRTCQLNKIWRIKCMQSLHSRLETFSNCENILNFSMCTSMDWNVVICERGLRIMTTKQHLKYGNDMYYCKSMVSHFRHTILNTLVNDRQNWTDRVTWHCLWSQVFTGHTSEGFPANICSEQLLLIFHKESLLLGWHSWLNDTGYSIHITHQKTDFYSEIFMHVQTKPHRTNCLVLEPEGSTPLTQNAITESPLLNQYNVFLLIIYQDRKMDISFKRGTKIWD